VRRFSIFDFGFSIGREKHQCWSFLLYAFAPLRDNLFTIDDKKTSTRDIADGGLLKR